MTASDFGFLGWFLSWLLILKWAIVYSLPVSCEMIFVHVDRRK